MTMSPLRRPRLKSALPIRCERLLKSAKVYDSPVRASVCVKVAKISFHSEKSYLVGPWGTYYPFVASVFGKLRCLFEEKLGQVGASFKKCHRFVRRMNNIFLILLHVLLLLDGMEGFSRLNRF